MIILAYFVFLLSTAIMAFYYPEKFDIFMVSVLIPLILFIFSSYVPQWIYCTKKCEKMTIKGSLIGFSLLLSLATFTALMISIYSSTTPFSYFGVGIAYSGFFVWLFITIIDNLKRRIYPLKNVLVVYSFIKTPYGSFLFVFILNLAVIFLLLPEALRIIDILKASIFSWTISYLVPSFFEAQTSRGWIILKYKGTFVGIWGVIKSKGLIALFQSILFGIYCFTSVYLVAFVKKWSLIDYILTLVSPEIIKEILIFMGIVSIFVIIFNIIFTRYGKLGPLPENYSDFSRKDYCSIFGFKIIRYP